MPSKQLTVVISAGQSRNPEKRNLERGVTEAAGAMEGVNVLCIPHLYDLAKDGETYQTLRQLETDLVVVTWLYDRAAHWILDRNGVRGQAGTVELLYAAEDEEPEEQDSAEERVIDSQPRPDRSIFCIDFRADQAVDAFINEITRIQREQLSLSTGITLGPLAQLAAASQLDDLIPTNDTYVGAPMRTEHSAANQSTLFGTASVVSIEEHPSRRWYPVIDFSRCTNCMECIDFCLFGVYGVDSLETIIVEQADNCRKGCPACSRVCPQNAIIFPQHKTPAIAGAPVEAGGLKIDLSKLFGAPESDEDAQAVAARERDEQLILAGRAPVASGTSVIDQRLSEKATKGQQPDELDALIDELDSLDL